MAGGKVLGSMILYRAASASPDLQGHRATRGLHQDKGARHDDFWSPPLIGPERILVFMRSLGPRSSELRERLVPIGSPLFKATKPDITCSTICTIHTHIHIHIYMCI